MKLFNHEKDLILKITNLVLLIWLVSSVALLYISVVNLVMPKPLMTYNEYKVSNCYYTADDTTNNKEYCQSSYESYKTNIKNTNYETKRNIFSFIGSIVIVTGALIILNRKKNKATEKEEAK